MRKLPPLSALRAFEAAARHMSFQRAAEELAVTPTAISHQIRLLEDICGQPLFRRHPRPVCLTPAGQRLFPVLCSGLDAFAMAIASLSTPAAQPPLRVTTPNAFASHWLVPRLPQWREAHPEIPLEVIGSDRILDLRAGDADVAIRYARSMPTQLAAQEIFRDTFFAMCSPSLLDQGRPVGSAGELRQLPLIHFDWMKVDSETPTWKRWWATARSVEPTLADAAFTCDLSFREEAHAIDAVLAGQGVAICSDIVLERELRSGLLVKAHDLSLPGYGFYLVHLPNHPRQQIIANFANWIRSA